MKDTAGESTKNTSSRNDVPRRDEPKERQRVPPMADASVLAPSQEEHMAKAARDALKAKILEKK